MFEDLKDAVCWANLEVVRRGLVIQTFGNVSAIDSNRAYMVIKPSGVPYPRLQAKDMVVVSLETGDVVEGNLAPSSDTPTHLVLYRHFEEIGGIVHTHSLFATSWAQARREIPPFGTTHADYCHGAVPCTRPLSAAEIQSDYEANTGLVIIERLRGHDPVYNPFVLVAGHGPFAWGKSAEEAVDHAELLEYIARLATQTIHIEPYVNPAEKALLDKHFFRKHGPGAYYGQKPRLVDPLIDRLPDTTLATEKE
jgi:L-ribulose-5-phosphate 4-epimerase